MHTSLNSQPLSAAHSFDRQTKTWDAFYPCAASYAKHSIDVAERTRRERSFGDTMKESAFAMFQCGSLPVGSALTFSA
jgi:hypothetical protein